MEMNGGRTLFIIFISLVLDLLGFTVILPLFPSLLEFYKFNDEGRLYSIMESTVSSFRKVIGVPDSENINAVLFGGLISAMFSFLQFLNSPIFGALSDVYGRKCLIIVSLVGSSISCLLWSCSSTFSLFICARFIAGISEANVSVTTAAIADLPSAKLRAHGMAVVGIAFSVGFVFGPLIGAWFATYATADSHFFFAPAMLSLCLIVLDICFVIFYFPETLPQSKRASSIADSAKELALLLNPFALFNFSAVKSLKATGNSDKGSSLRKLGTVYFLYLFTFSGLEFTLTFLVHRRFLFSRMDQGRMFGMMGLLMALLQGGYVRRKMSGREKNMAMKGIEAVIPSFIILSFCSSLWMLCIGLFLFSFAAASVIPCLSSIATAHGTESEKGRVMGIIRSLGALARATGPIAASASYWLLGAQVTYIAGGIMMLLPLFCLHRYSPAISSTKDKET